MTQQPKSQIDKFREAARQLETDDDERRFDETLGKIAKASPKVCPECGHVFQGNGWDGIDAHWKAKHDNVMPYSEAWPLLRDCRYPKK